MGPWYLEVMWYAVKAMAMRLRYATAPSPSTTSFVRHLNRWLHQLSDKIKNGLGLLIPPSMTWEGGMTTTTEAGTTFRWSSTSSMS
eukprot:scaffold63615_cov53-Phaeocystis_antarctica.AAC.2